MTYWDMQVHPGNRREDFPVEKVRELLKTSGRIGMGESWDNDLGQPKTFREEMSVGDVVVIRDGGDIVALVRVTGECIKVPKTERTSLVWYGIARDIEIVSTDVFKAESMYWDRFGLRATDGMSLRRTLNRCHLSGFARFWYTKVCGCAEPSFTWMPFYLELSNRLLDFKDDHMSLVDVLRQVFERSGTGLEIPSNGKRNAITDLDPFSFFALFNRRLNDGNKRKLMLAVKDVLRIRAAAPMDFNGIPHADNRNAYFFRKGAQASDIDNLWKMFVIAIAYAECPNEDRRAEFIRLYDAVVSQKGVGRNLTMGFFWIRPEFYVGLDARNIDFLFSSDQFSKMVTNKYGLLRKGGVASGECYLAFRDELLDFIQASQYESFVQLSYQAYMRYVDYKQDEKLKDCALARRKEDEEVFREPVKRLMMSCRSGEEFERKFDEIYKAKKVRARFPELFKEHSMVTEKKTVAVVSQRVGQPIFRTEVLLAYKGKCCISGLPILDLLEACHILGWKEDECNRLSPNNGLCMSVIYHRAFDRHLIAIDDEYRLHISPGLKREYPQDVCQEFFYKYEGRRIFVPKDYPPSKELLRRHFALLKK